MSYVNTILNEKVPVVEVATDFATFFGGGILASYSLTTWINDPISKGGIAFASLLNAAVLRMGNEVAKNDENSTFLYNKAVTVAALALSGFAAPYLVTSLTSRFGVVLSMHSSIHLSLVNLAIKWGSEWSSQASPDNFPYPRLYGVVTTICILKCFNLIKFFFKI